MIPRIRNCHGKKSNSATTQMEWNNTNLKRMNLPHGVNLKASRATASIGLLSHSWRTRCSFIRSSDDKTMINSIMLAHVGG